MSEAGQSAQVALSEAVTWFNLRRSGAMNADDLLEFSDWLDSNPENKTDYAELETIWSAMDSMAEDPTILEMRDKAESVVKRRERGRILSMLAVGFAMTGLGALAVPEMSLTFDRGWLAPPPTQEFRTSVGQRTTVTLIDHSVVTLDTDTVVRTRFSSGKRLIELERGRAYFQVAKDRHRPFVVVAAGKTVNATGTAFDVRVEPDRFEVTLIEGRVRVQDRTDTRADATVANMRPGWRLAVGGDARWRMEAVNVERETSWHAGMLVFDGPLAEAAAEMNRYSQRKIVFRGAPPAAAVIGNFRAGDIENFVEAVRMNRLARVVSETDDEIELAAR